MERLDRYSVVSIATRYWLHGPGLKPRWGARVSVQTGPDAHPASYTMGTGALHRV